MTRLLPKNVALCDQINAVLRDSDPLPMSTMHICKAVGGEGNEWRVHSDVYRMLRRLERIGDIARYDAPDFLGVYWQSALPLQPDVKPLDLTGGMP